MVLFKYQYVDYATLIYPSKTYIQQTEVNVKKKIKKKMILGFAVNKVRCMEKKELLNNSFSHDLLKICRC